MTTFCLFSRRAALCLAIALLCLVGTCSAAAESHLRARQRAKREPSDAQEVDEDQADPLADQANGKAPGKKQSVIPAFYHSTDQLHAEFQRMADGPCQGLMRMQQHEVEVVGKDGKTTTTASVPVAYIGTDVHNNADESSEKRRVMMLFGEHARELISPETALQMGRDLCTQSNTLGSARFKSLSKGDPATTTYASFKETADDSGKSTQDLAKSVLSHSTFMIVPLSNPIGRRIVEDGETCRRTNGAGVDLNRNWGDHWEPAQEMPRFMGGAGSDDTYPGKAAFSERETVLVKDLAAKYNPSLFATVHSGTLGMYTPYAYSKDEPSPEGLNTRFKHADGSETRQGDGVMRMKSILGKLDSEYCNCPSGAAGKQVGYLCPGTCLDYVYDKLHTPYAFAFEIYADPADQEQLHEEYKSERLQEKEMSIRNDEFIQTGFSHKHYSSFLQEREQTSHQINSKMSPGECLGFFNPTDQASYDATTRKWSHAFLEMVEMAHGKSNDDGQGGGRLHPTEITKAVQRFRSSLKRQRGAEEEVSQGPPMASEQQEQQQDSAQVETDVDSNNVERDYDSFLQTKDRIPSNSEQERGLLGAFADAPAPVLDKMSQVEDEQMHHRMEEEAQEGLAERRILKEKASKLREEIGGVGPLLTRFLERQSKEQKMSNSDKFKMGEAGKLLNAFDADIRSGQKAAIEKSKRENEDSPLLKNEKAAAKMIASSMELGDQE
jgi:hypothetical protein